MTGTEKFLANPLEFARTHPILVDASPVNFSAAGMDARIKWAAGRQGETGAKRHTLTTAEGLCVARIEKNHHPANEMHKGYVLRVTPFTSGNEVPADAMTVWFLSWNSAGGQVDMHIPTDTVEDHNQQNVTPRYFFTTALTGCSVFVRGARTRPEIFHSGGEAKTWNGPSIDHWRGLFQAHRPRPFERGRFAEVNHTDYLGPTVPSHEDNFKFDRSARINAYIMHVISQEMALHPDHAINIDYVLGIGCVFGIRGDTGRWRLYLQENVRILYRRGSDGPPQWVNRALQVKQIWPHGDHAPFVNPAPKGLV